MLDYGVDDVASEAVEAIDALGFKALVIVFDPADALDEHFLYSNAAAAQLLPVLKALAAQIDTGDVRMPVDASVRWVAIPAGE